MVEDMPESPSGQCSVNLVGHFGACDRNLAEYMLGRAGFIAAVGDDFFQKRVHERGDSQYAVFVAEDIFMRTSRMKFHLVVPVSMPESSFGYSGSLDAMDLTSHFSDTALTTPVSLTIVHSLSGLYSFIAPAMRKVFSPRFR